MTVRVGFIGAGSRSISHMIALTQQNDVEIVGVTDLDASRAHGALDRANAKRPDSSPPIVAHTFTDYRADA